MARRADAGGGRVSPELSPADIDALQAVANGTPKPKFNARQLALKLDGETPVARGGGELFTYRDGHYRPGGRENLRERITRELGDDWKRHRAEETIGYLTDSAPQLWESPPLDRINLANGILDVTTGELNPHSPEFLSPVRLPVAYDPTAECPAIEKFLGEVLAVELVEVFYELAGYLTVPDNRLQQAVMLLGAGSNGKSRALDLLTAMLGRENVSAVALHQLEDNRFAPVRLYGKLANIFADLDHRTLQSSSMFKSITGGDRIEGERKRQDSFSFQPYARLLFSANEPPPTSDHSDAYFRRWLILPFDNRFDGSKADRNLLAKLTTPTELSGLLNRSLARLYGVRTRGHFTMTATAEKAAERFRVDSDSVAGFIAERCNIDPDARVRQSATFPAYRDWCAESNRRPLGKQNFNRRLAELIPTLAESKSGGVRYWTGIELDLEAGA